MSEQVIIDGELNLENNIDGLPNEQIIVNVTGASKIIDKASGKIVSIVDGAENEKLLSAVVNIEPVQDLHGYDYPWPAGGGKNLIPLTAEDIKSAAGGTWSGNSITKEGITWTIKTDDDGNVVGITASGTPTGTSQPTIARFNISPGTYTFSGITDGSVNTWYIRYVARDANGAAITIEGSVFIDVYGIATTKTLPNNVSYMNAYIGVKTTVNNKEFKPMVRLSSVTAPTFEPYSNICPISGWSEVKVWVKPTYDTTLTPTATISLGRTVYGGTLDVVRGKLNAKPYYASYSGQSLVGPWISSHDKYVAGATPTTGAQVVDMGATGTDYDVTPQTIKTLLGVNNIWADAGDTSIEYVADTKLYIQRLTSPTEDDMIANENIASGKFFMVGNDLYFSTAAIVAGETIAPGTNCTKLSLAEALNNINA